MSKEKQIEEMAKDVARSINWCKEEYAAVDCLGTAASLYGKGYRKQEWISVDERLPSEDEQRDEYEELVPFLVVERDTKYPYRAFYDGNEWGDGLMKIRGITHWMPLPEPPKMKGGAEETQVTTKKFFSPEEVRKMSQKEVHENYQAIMNSMKEWK